MRANIYSRSSVWLYEEALKTKNSAQIIFNNKSEIQGAVEVQGQEPPLKMLDYLNKVNENLNK